MLALINFERDEVHHFDDVILLEIFLSWQLRVIYLNAFRVKISLETKITDV